MKLSSIPQFLRDLNRSLDILAILSKYRLADWIDRFDIDIARGVFRSAEGEDLAALDFESRVRLALVELGPTFIKFGQMLSTRSDLIGHKLAEELSSLQSDVPADPPDVVRKIVEEELGQPIDDLFQKFSDVPLASASIGQVHRAILKNGQRVVVKVQHANIQSKVLLDLEILSGIAELLEQVPEFKTYRPRATIAEFQRAMRRELDFGREERSLQQFATMFHSDPTVKFPAPYPEFCTGRILTMEELVGVPMADHAKLREMGVDLQEVARRGADIFLEMIFQHGFYHADPHPGNLLVLSGHVIGILDCGMVGRVDEALRDDIQEILLAIAQADSEQLVKLLMRVGETPKDLDQISLRQDVAEFLAHHTHQSLDRLDFSGALNEMLDIIRTYQIHLPATLAMLLKVLMVLEGTARRLHPRFSLMDLISRFQVKLFWRQFSPQRQLLWLRRLWHEWRSLGEVLPRNLIDILQQVQSGRFEIHLEHRGLEPSVNRLVFGMLTSALFLGSSWMLSHGVGPVFQGIPLFGAFGCVLSLVLGLRLLWAISKSGHLDRKQNRNNS